MLQPADEGVLLQQSLRESVATTENSANALSDLKIFSAALVDCLEFRIAHGQWPIRHVHFLCENVAASNDSGWFCSLERTAKTPARSGAECGVKAISAIGCAAQLAEQHKPRARARTHRGRTRAQWPQHPGPSSPRKSRVCDCSHTQCSNTRPRAGRTLAERRPNAARCHDFARADSARASRARQRRARQRRARQ